MTCETVIDPHPNDKIAQTFPISESSSSSGKRGNIIADVVFATDGSNSKVRELINFDIENGTNGLVPAGTTGESPTLSHEEHEKVIELCIKEAKGKIPVIAGTGSNSTTEAVALTKHAEKAGADGVLVVTPYYNKPTQEGLYQHYKLSLIHI